MDLPEVAQSVLILRILVFGLCFYERTSVKWFISSAEKTFPRRLKRRVSSFPSFSSYTARAADWLHVSLGITDHICPSHLLVFAGACLEACPYLSVSERVKTLLSELQQIIWAAQTSGMCDSSVMGVWRRWQWQSSAQRVLNSGMCGSNEGKSAFLRLTSWPFLTRADWSLGRAAEPRLSDGCGDSDGWACGSRTPPSKCLIWTHGSEVSDRWPRRPEGKLSGVW